MSTPTNNTTKPQDSQKWIKPELQVLSVNEGTLGTFANPTDTTPTSNPAS